MRSPAFLTLPLLLASCSSSPDTVHETRTGAAPNRPATSAEPLDTARRATVGARADTLLTATKRHLFSSPSSPDVFSLVLRGDSLLTSEATFTITTAQSQPIFREVLTAADLEAALVYEMKSPTATVAEREAYVRRRVQAFFADNSFRKPAVPATAPAPAALDQATWDDLRRRPDAVGFQYLVGKEDQRRLAWSPVRRQVVRVL